jgi:hypothetical protein
VYYNLILQVGSYVSEKTAAGGHQGYAALGGLYTQARPMCPHVYGPLHVQESIIPVRLIFLLNFFISFKILRSEVYTYC